MTRSVRSRTGGDGGYIFAQPPPPCHTSSSDSDGETSSDEEQPSIVTLVRKKMLDIHARSQSLQCGAPGGGPQRRRARMWSGPSTAFSATTEAENDRQNGSGRTKRRMDEYDSDDEDDSDDECEEQFFQDDFLPRGRCHSKKRRKRLSRLDSLDSAAYHCGSFQFHLKKKSVVTFSNPLVTETWTRPRTLPEDAAKLFYCKADERQFREEYRRERRMRLLGEWESDSDEPSDESSDEEACSMAAEPCVTAEGSSSPPDAEPATQDPNEVTESDESGDNFACDAESSNSSGSDTNDEHSDEENPEV